jgi:hypothetical protein
MEPQFNFRKKHAYFNKGTTLVAVDIAACMMMVPAQRRLLNGGSQGILYTWGIGTKANLERQ